ncbi:MAG: PaaI family thioesterase [candidate division Zixibacteria bacterium]|nr:PaaI family thioesterase [candidate division Zixibacteria bacterium]MCI0596036.1 PaaI family thioesterase [candidate division Zixibacteria bacterium]
MRRLSKETERVLRKTFSDVPFLSDLKVKLGPVGPGFARVSIHFERRLAQMYGFMHGGVVAALADTAATYASNTLLFPERLTITAELKINYTAPVKTQKAYADATVLHSGSKTSVSEVKVFDSAKKLCAAALITNLIVPRETYKINPHPKK